MDELQEDLQAALGDEFEIQRELGRGGMATVYLARQKTPARDVAIKVLDPDLTTRIIRKRFLREVELIATLNHPNIVPIIVSGEKDDLLYFVMPYIRGDTLRAKMAGGRKIPLDEALRLMREVADAVAHAHNNGIVHRDIKPENVMIQEGHAIVMDFGIARAVDCSECSADTRENLTSVGLPLGTPLYMSPEQAVGAKEIDGRSDVYGMGCVLYEMLEGKPPFTGRTTHEILQRQTDDPVPRVSGGSEAVPRHIKNAIRRSLAKNPDARFGTATEFAAALDRSSGAYQTPKRRVRDRTGGLVIATIALAGVAVLAARGIIGGTAPPLDSHRVVVEPFVPRTPGDSLRLGEVAAEWLRRGIARTGLTEAVTTNVTLQTARVMADDGRRPTPDDIAISLGAGVAVSGLYQVERDSVRFAIRVSNLLTHKAEALAIAFARGDESAGIERVRQRVMTVMANNVDPLLRSWAARTFWPPEIGAYSLFVGAQACFADGDRPCTASLATDAYARDRAMAAAGLLAVRTHVELGNVSAARELLRTIDSTATDLTPFEQQIRSYYGATIDGNRQAAYGALHRAAEMAPASEASFMLAGEALNSNRPREAVERLEALDPERGYLRNRADYYGILSSALHRLAQHQKELEVAREAVRRFPTLVSPMFYELRALAALGETSDLRQRLDRLNTMPAQPGWERTLVTREIAAELRAHGNSDAAQQLADELVATTMRLSGATTATVASRSALARALYAARRFRDAGAIAEEAWRDSGSTEMLALSGAVAARRGNVERATRALSALMSDTAAVGKSRYLAARVAAQMADWNMAVDLLREADEQGYARMYDAHSDPDFDPMRGFQAFVDLLRPRG